MRKAIVISTFVMLGVFTTLSLPVLAETDQTDQTTTTTTQSGYNHSTEETTPMGDDKNNGGPTVDSTRSGEDISTKFQDMKSNYSGREAQSGDAQKNDTQSSDAESHDTQKNDDNKPE